MTSASSRRPLVLGVDTVGTGRVAAAWAADEAARRHLPLRLVHAVRPAIHDIVGFDGNRYHEALRQSGARLLDQAAQRAYERHPELTVSTAVGDGTPSQVLCRESHQAELVVLGSRSLSRAEEVFSASSAAVPVSAQAACPVAVVRDPEHVTQDPPYLVVGVDGSLASAEAVEYAAATAALRGAELHAVRVWLPPLIVPVDEHVAVQELRRQLSEATAGWSDRYPDVRITHDVLRGHPVEELAKVSEHALAVVVGRRGRGGFTGMRLGSVPHGLLHRAHCPVVTVPEPTARSAP
ncbi:universal stress protein [Kitasatospora sp. NPDC127111]|uniref:universal stress protein n=1 Tax=Kitasatospora sp. NPDC127111 TaxID=3345363 RepID=UPI003638D539